MYWFYLLALGDGRREGNPEDENGVLESFLECQLAESQTSPHSLLPGPPLHSGEVQQEAECGCLPSLRFPGRAPWPRVRVHAVFAAMTWWTGLFFSLGLSILNYGRSHLVLTS